MFIIPKWEEDVPNTNTNFAKTTQKKNKKLNGITKSKLKKKDKAITTKLTSNLKSNGSKTINNLPSCKKAKNRKTNEKLKKPIKEDKHKISLKKQTKDIECDVNSEIQNFDTDKPDEVILNFKKKRLDEAFKKDDVEDLLFAEKTLQIIPTPKSNIKSEIRSPKTGIEQRTNRKHEKKVKRNGTFTADKTSQCSTNKIDIFEDMKNHESQNVNPKNKCNNRFNNQSKISETPNNEFKSVSKNRNEGKHHIKKEKLKKLLDTSNIQRNSITTYSSKLRQRMLDRLKAAQFRYLNEKLYTSSGSEAQQLFQSDPVAFQTYHQGYQQQLKKWPINPLEIIINKIKKLPRSHIVADMGCGEAMLSKRVPQVVRSFDLVACSPVVEVCDIAHTPLLVASVDVVVYCLALMGTDLTQYLVEANRVLKIGGLLLIAEVESRFDKVEDFTRSVQQLGFNLKKLDKSHKVFFFMEFSKVRDPPAKKSKLPTLTLKPCLYKKR